MGSGGTQMEHHEMIMTEVVQLVCTVEDSYPSCC